MINLPLNRPAFTCFLPLPQARQLVAQRHKREIAKKCAGPYHSNKSDGMHSERPLQNAIVGPQQEKRIDQHHSPIEGSAEHQQHNRLVIWSQHNGTAKGYLTPQHEKIQSTFGPASVGAQPVCLDDISGNSRAGV